MYLLEKARAMWHEAWPGQLQLLANASDAKHHNTEQLEGDIQLWEREHGVALRWQPTWHDYKRALQDLKDKHMGE